MAVTSQAPAHTLIHLTSVVRPLFFHGVKVYTPRTLWRPHDGQPALTIPYHKPNPDLLSCVCVWRFQAPYLTINPTLTCCRVWGCCCSRRQPIDKFYREDWDRILKVDLTGPFVVSQALIPLMEKGGSYGQLGQYC